MSIVHKICENNYRKHISVSFPMLVVHMMANVEQHRKGEMAIIFYSIGSLANK